MSALEQPFRDAIAAGKIEGAILEGRSTSGQSYTSVLGNRTLLDGATKPLETSNLIFLASATKLLTTIAALQCCEKGLLSLDGDQAANLPNIAEKGVLLRYDDATGEPVYEPLKKPLSLRHMLNHSSGLLYDFMEPKLKKWREANPAPKLPRSSLERMTQPLAFQPGEDWTYGVGLDVAGYLVEKVSGLKLDAYFRRHLLEPLSVDARDIAFYPIKEGMADRMPDVNPKDPNGEGKSAGAGTSYFDEGETECFGGQGGYATSGAYVAVLQSITANDGRVLQPSSVAEMFTASLEPGAQKAFEATLAGPFGGYFDQGTSGTARSYGLSGFYVGEDGDGGMGKGSLAWGGGMNTVWFMDPANGVCGFASPQLGLPADAEFALVLKGGFRRGLQAQLQGETRDEGNRL